MSNDKKRHDYILKRDTMNDLLIKKNKLLVKGNEYAGSFDFGGKKCSNSKCFKFSFGTQLKVGKKCYSDIPNTIISFHTHPVYCYIDGRAIWGWPSGMDMQGVLKLKQTQYHIVFALEGTYIISVPEFVRNNISIADTKRVGELFSMTHEFRTIDNYEVNGERFKKLFKLKYKSDHPLEIWLLMTNDFKMNINGKLVKLFKVDFIPNISFQYLYEPNEIMEIMKKLNKNNIEDYIDVPSDTVLEKIKDSI